jgi:dipeptidyl aminopeptidase/acylaminoacyl peptidase
VDLTPGEGFVEYVDVSPDGRWLYYAANIGDMERRHVWRVRTSGGKAEQLTKGDGVETMPVVPGGTHIAAMTSSTKQPLAVAVVDANGGTPRVLSPVPQSFPIAKQVVPTDVVIEAADGVKAHSQLFLPPDMKPGEKRPALLFIHGGSRRQMLLGYHYMYFYHMAYAVNQYFANKGYVVLSVNYRSGIGYGREFRTAEKVGRQGNSEYADVLAAGKYLRDRADVDPARVGVWGLSYGGILTAQALAGLGPGDRPARRRPARAC